MKPVTMEQFTVMSTNGKNRLSGILYIPGEAPRGIVQISHGMCEYIDRYHPFMQFLADNGYIVCGHDHLGHGNSSSPEEYGYFDDRNGCRILVDDLHQVTRFVKERYPGLPCFLFGHSMGSFIARLYLNKYSHELTGAVICGTGGPDPMAKLGRGVAALVCRTKGPRHRSATLDRLAFGSFNKHFTPCRTSKDWLTRDEKIVDRYLSDPKCMFIFTASAFRDLSALSDMANSSRWYQSLDPELPVLLIAGQEDPVGKYGKGVRRVYENLEKTGLQDASIKLYPHCRHELTNELNCNEVYADVLSWLAARTVIRSREV